MLLSQSNIHNLVISVNQDIESFDANAHEYNNFVSRIDEAAENYEKACLRYADNYGLITEITIGGRFTTVIVEDELPYEELLDIPEIKAFGKQLQSIIAEKLIDQLACDELMEHRAIFNYEIVVPTNAKLIMEGIERAGEYAGFLKSQELARLQNLAKEWITGGK